MSARDKELEDELRILPYVIEVAVFSDSAGHPVEIQVWTQAGSEEREVRTGISNVLASRGQLQHNERTYVFELTGQVVPPISKTPLQAISVDPVPAAVTAPPLGRRARIGRISVFASQADSHASVSLVYSGRESEGVGKGRRTQHALRVTAATTLEAAQALLGRPGLFMLKGATLVETLGYSAVLVILETTVGTSGTLIGSSLVRDSEIPQATVRATLDAVNRQLEMLLPGEI